MKSKIVCPSPPCRRPMMVDSEYAGTTVACPYCNQHIVVPFPASKGRRGRDVVWVVVTLLAVGAVFPTLNWISANRQSGEGTAAGEGSAKGAFKAVANAVSSALTPPKPGSERWEKAAMAEIEFNGQSGVLGLLFGVGGTPAEEMAEDAKDLKDNMEEMKKEVGRLRLLNAAEAQANADARRRTIALDGSPVGGNYDARAVLFPDRFKLWPKNGAKLEGKWLDVRQREGTTAVFVIDVRLDGELEADGTYRGTARGTLLQPGSGDEKTMLFVNGPFSLKPILAR